MSQTEQFQKLFSWLCLSSQYEQRPYLETHLELVTADYEHLLDLFISQCEDSPGEQQRLQVQRRILQDAYRHGGTAEAVREAYINEYGGLILDLPPWLIEVQQLLSMLTPPRQSERMGAISKFLLREALEHLQGEAFIHPEIAAELQFQLGQAFANDPCDHTLHHLQVATTAYEAALRVYTRDRYPKQYGKLQKALGDVYQRLFQSTGQRNYLQRAIRCYELALQLYAEPPHDFAPPS